MENAEVLAILEQRWMLRLMGVLAEAPDGFRALQGRCGGMSSSTLSTRLQQLQQHGWVEVDGDQRYHLTAMGRDLVGVLLTGLQGWQRRWRRSTNSGGGG